MKRLLLVGVTLVGMTAEAVLDCPDVQFFNGTGYYADGWFDYKLGVHSDDGSLLFQTVSSFVVSPCFQSPIRRVVLQVRSAKTEPTRYLRLWPFVDGIESATNAFDCAVRRVAQADTYEFVAFDFEPTSSVNAFRLGMDGSGTGNWYVEKICVAFGEKEADEDAQLKELTNPLSVPANFAIASITENMLKLAADSVEGAAGYRFRVSRLEGAPPTTLAEDFDLVADELKMSPGWQLMATNAKLTACTEVIDSSYVDKNGSSVMRALKIASGSSKEGPVCVEILSPEVTAPVTGCSFVSKRNGDGSNLVTVYGRQKNLSDWKQLGDSFEMSTSMTTTERLVDVTNGFVQVKFKFTADSGSTCRPCALDTLRVFYGGNETRVPVADEAKVLENPVWEAEGLQTARYECQVQAVGDNCRDSLWSDPLVLDLAWHGLTVSAPTGIVANVSGDKLTVSWQPVDGADHYLVDIVSDDPALEIVRGAVSASCLLTLTTKAVGDYKVTVTAVAPGGLAKAASEPEVVNLPSERFRKTGPIPLSTVRHGFYEESFDGLSSIGSETETWKANLDYWQFFKGSSEVDKLLYTEGTNSTAGGVYVFGGSEGSPMLGTLATGDKGCLLGLAFLNDSEMSVVVTSLVFKTIQRNLKVNAATYCFDWRVTAEDASVNADAAWQNVTIPESALYTTASPFPPGQADYRQTVSVADELSELKIPAGSMFIVRWRHEKLASGPMMAIDDVQIGFRKITGFSVSVK